MVDGSSTFPQLQPPLNPWMRAGTMSTRRTPATFRTKDCSSAKSEGWVSVRDQQERIGNDSKGPSAYPYYEIEE
jgi:hypothetical protein